MKPVLQIVILFFLIIPYSINVNASSNTLVHSDKSPILFKPTTEGKNKLSDFRKNQLLVKFTKKAERKRNQGGGHSKRLKRFHKKGKLRMKRLAKRLKKKSKSGFERWHKLDLPRNMKIKEAKKLLEDDPDIEYVEPNYIQSITLTPNDEKYSSLWGMNNISAPTAWESETGSADVVVAVIDTGVDYRHEDLKANMWRNFGEIPNNQIDDDGNGYVDDVYGYDFVNDDGDPLDDHAHGTHVAGTIAAIGNNTVGVAGVSWNTRIMALKFLTGYGYGYIEDGIKAIEYAAANGAHIINASWGGGGYSQAMKDAIDAANEVLFVAAAGNANKNTDDEKHYPSSYDSPNIMSVAALVSSTQMAFFSNYGPLSVDLAAPGQNITSSVPTTGCQWFPGSFGIGIIDYCHPTGYRAFNGTSMAAPHVAGAAALLKAYSPNLSSLDIKQKLMGSVDKVPGLTGKILSEGSLNVARAIESTIAETRSLTINFSDRELKTINSESYTTDLNITNNTNSALDVSLKVNLPDNRIKLTFSNSLNLAAFEEMVIPVTIHLPDNLPKDGYQILMTATDDENLEYHSQLVIDHDAPDFQRVFQKVDRNVTVGNSSDYIFKLKSNSYSGDVQLNSFTNVDGLKIAITPEILSLSPDTETNFVVTINADSTVTHGSKRIYLQATDGNTIRNMEFDLTVFVSGVDLVIDEFSLPEQTPLKLGRGNGFTYSITYSNIGDKPTLLDQVGIYLSDDPIVDTSDRLISGVANNGLPNPLYPGESNHSRVTFNVETNIPSGNYYIAAIADYNNKIDEHDESNNSSPVYPLEVINDTDLIIESIEFSKNTINAGDTISVPYTVKNIGSVALNAFEHRFYTGYWSWSKSSGSTFVDFYLSEDPIIDINDIQLKTDFVRKSIEGGASIRQTVSLTIPIQNTKNGKYYIGAIVNSNQEKFYYGEIINYKTPRLENNYKNNVSSVDEIELLSDIDLVAEKLVLKDQSVAMGSMFSGVFTLINSGTTNVDKVNVGYYLSTDNILDINTDRYVQNTVVKNIGSGNSHEVQFNIYAYPNSMQAGKYYLFAIIDNKDLIVSEIDKTNNVLKSEEIDIQWDIDVMIDSVTYDASTVQPGDSISANVVVKNSGASWVKGWVILQAHLSKDKLLSDDDYFITNTYVSYGMSGGSQFSKIVPITLPNIPEGDYNVIFSIKSKPEWFEKNTKNNVLAGESFSIKNDVNLQITQLSTTTVNIDGSPFDVNSITVNSGSMDSTPYETNYYLSSDNLISKEDILIGNSNSPPLVGGSSISSTVTLVTSDSIAAGQYYLGAIVDPNNQISEINESDNTAVGNVVGVLSDPDLTLKNVSVDTQKIGVGENLAIAYTIENIGNSVVNSTWVYVYFGGSYVNRFSISELLAGQEISRTYYLPMTYRMRRGIQDLKLVVDGNNAVVESSEDNNTFVVPQVELVEDIDLVINAVDYKTENINIDDSLSLSAEIQNSGTTKAFSYFDVSATLVNATTDLPVQVLHKERVQFLDANTQKFLSWPNVTMPSVASGNYFIRIDIGTSSYFKENSIDNNQLSGPTFQITQYVDLKPTNISSDTNTITLGEPFSLSYSLSNNGASATAGKFRVGYYLSTDIVIDSTDILVGYSDSNALAGNSAATLNDEIVIPVATKLGNFYFGIIVDDLNSEDETDESNNSLLAGLITVQAVADVCPSGCQHTSIQTAVDSTSSGGTIIVGAGTYNETVTIGDNKTLFALEGPKNTIIDATDLNSSVIKHTRNSMHIEGFTIRGGSNDYGGGIRLSSGVVTIKNNVIRDNTATIGGSAVGGGYRYGTTAYLYNNIITNNISTGPSGTVAAWGMKEVRGNIFSDNQVNSGSGGGISTLGHVIIDKNIFVGNSAKFGGAINTNGYSGATISNTLIANNSSGVFVSSYSSVRIINSTIADNEGTGILIWNYSSGSRLENSIVSGNSNSISTGRYSSVIETVNSITSDDVDPMFVNSAEGNYHLSIGSPAIDTGGDSGLDSDLDGTFRPQDGDGLGAGETGDGSDYDMGAYEFVNPN